jgi:hypothetical protein
MRSTQQRNRLVTVAAVASIVLSGTLAHADPSSSSPIDEQTAGQINHGTVRIDRRVVGQGPTGVGAANSSRRAASSSERVIDSTAADMMTAFCADANADASAAPESSPIEALCGFVAEARRAAVPGRGEVLRAFRELGLYRGVVRSDPGRASFVNLETYFWCGDATRTCAAIGEAERTVTLLGQAVRIRPRIVAYEWRFGDGGGGVRTSAVRVAHVYDRAGAMAVSVTLTWTADYAVGGGGFGPVDGTTTTTSPVRVLPVQEVQAVAR